MIWMSKINQDSPSVARGNRGTITNARPRISNQRRDKRKADMPYHKPEVSILGTALDLIEILHIPKMLFSSDGPNQHAVPAYDLDE